MTPRTVRSATQNFRFSFAGTTADNGMHYVRFWLFGCVLIVIVCVVGVAVCCCAISVGAAARANRTCAVSATPARAWSGPRAQLLGQLLLPQEGAEAELEVEAEDQRQQREREAEAEAVDVDILGLGSVVWGLVLAALREWALA